jgi:hypothetical protein
VTAAASCCRGAPIVDGAFFIVVRWSDVWKPGPAPMREAAGAARLVGKEVLDLGVDASEVVVGPAAKRLEEARIESQQKALAVGHERVALRCTATRC